MKARAVWFTSPRTAEIREESLPAIGRRDLLVRGRISLISAGTEMNVYRGQVATPDELNMPTAAGEFPFPMKFAYQIVGEVEAAGLDAGFGTGDRVFCYHPHQDRFAISTGVGTDDLMAGASMVFPIPDDLSDERAAFANLFCVAYNALLDVPVRVGDVVAVSGIGVIGTFAAYLARLTASRLVLIDPLPQRRGRTAWLEPDDVVAPDEAVEAIKSASDGRGADVFIEASGATPALQVALDATGNEGTITVISYYGNRGAMLRLSPEFHLRRQRIVSSMVGAIGSGLQPRWNASRRMAVAMERLRGIDVESLITHRIPFDDAPSGYQAIDERPEETLAVLLDYR